MCTYVYKNTSIEIFIAAFFIIAKNWKQLKCSSVVEQINKFWCIHTMEYSDIRDKKKEAGHKREYAL